MNEVSQAIYDAASVMLECTTKLAELRRNDIALCDKLALIMAQKKIDMARRELLNIAVLLNEQYE